MLQGMTTYPVTERTRLHRRATRGSYDAEVVHGILDADPTSPRALIQ